MTSTTLAPDPRIAQLLARMRQDGITRSPEAILDAVERPQWDATRGLQDWRDHVPPSVRQDWEALPLATRLCVYGTAALAAMADEAGAPMVTGPAG